MRSPAHIFQIVSMAAGIAICVLPSLAKGVHVPKHCPVKSHQSTECTVFSSPDSQDSVLAEFVGKKGQPLNSEMDRVYAFDPKKLLSDLTAEQNQKIKAVQDGTNLSVQAVQEQIASLDKKSNAPQISDLRKQIVDLRRESSKQLEAILSDSQRDQLQRMRHGEFVCDMTEITGRKESDK